MEDTVGHGISDGGNAKAMYKQYGGGVYIQAGSFSMSNGTISNNTTNFGGAVCVQVGTFSMTGGTISGNTAIISGGGVHLSGAWEARNTFNMSGGTITSNTAHEFGGGVDMSSRAIFNKSGGTIIQGVYRVTNNKR